MGLRKSISSSNKRRNDRESNQRSLINNKPTTTAHLTINIRKEHPKTTDRKHHNNLTRTITPNIHNKKCNNKFLIANKILNIYNIIHITSSKLSKLSNLNRKAEKTEEITS